MNIVPTDLRDVVMIEPRVFGDDRGFFMESYNRAQFTSAIGRDIEFVQDNHSRSVRGVLRGLHLQAAPKAQTKLVRVIQGEIFDVAVDVRQGSATFGRWIGERLSAENRRQLWIPEGFAHGFVVLSDVAEVLYKTSDYYSPEHERAVAWNDPEIGIEWPIQSSPILSAKDASAPGLRELFR